MTNPFRTIRWRLIVSSLLAVGIPLIAMSLALGHMLWDFYLGELQTQLHSTATLLAENVAPLLQGRPDTKRLDQVADRWYRHTGIRLVIADSKGVVRAATRGSFSPVVGRRASPKLVPGLVAAVHGFANATTWRSPEHDFEETMYVNMPVQTGRADLGAVRVSYSLGQVLKRVHQIRAALVLGVVLYAVLLIGLAFWLAVSLAAPVEALNQSARKLSAGELDLHLPVGGTQEVEQLAQTLNAMTERLRSLEGLRRRHVSDVSHELRAPLAAIRGMAETLELHGDEDPELARRYLPRIIAKTDRLARLATQLLDLAHIESASLAPDLGPVDLEEVVDEAVRTACDGRAGGPQVEQALAPDLPELRADRDRLVQMLLNLVDNALGHSPEGARVKVRARLLGAERLELVVEDEGSGIPPEHLPHLFERFYRVDAARTAGGAGLGLSIVREIVEMHGGTIEVESSRGVGTAFTVVLPVAGPANKREDASHP